MTYSITAKQRNYMIAVPKFRKKMLTTNLPNGSQSFRLIASHEDYLDFMNRCKFID